MKGDCNMVNLLQFKGKNDYFHITEKRDFDDLIAKCLECGITSFSSGNPLDSDEYYNHDDVYVKIKSNGTLAFVAHKDNWNGRIHSWQSDQPACYAVKKEERKIVNSTTTSAKEKKAMKFDGIFKGMGIDLVKTNEFGIDLLSGKIAYIGKDTATIIDGKRDLTTTLPDMVKTVPLMFIPTPVTSLAEGDIIKRNNKCGVITKIDGQQIQIQNYSGTVSSETVPKHILMQTSLVPKLFNPFDGFGAGTDGQINPMMAMLFMGDEGGKDDDSLVTTFMLLQAFQGGAGDANPQMAQMLPLLLMKNGGKDDMLKIMMFSGMAGGTSGNPFASNPMLPLLLMGDGGLGSGGDMKDILMMSMLGGGNMFGGMFGGASTTSKTAKPKAKKTDADAEEAK